MLILDQLSVLGAAADVGPGQDRCKVEGGKKEEGNRPEGTTVECIYRDQPTDSWNLAA